MKYILIVLSCFFAIRSISQNFTGGFNFAIPYFDSTVQPFFPKFKITEITNADRVTVLDDKFMVNGQPYKFWGANLVVGAAFPSSTDAQRVAAHAAKMGINLFRFHQIDNNWGNINTTLLTPWQSTRSLNPVTLDKLDYFIYQLKRKGIYTNMNLNVGREFNLLDGVAGADSLKDYAKGAVIFDKQLIDLQKEYAQQLLTHVNPYTGVKLAEDPALALVEIINENTLHGMWKENQLRPVKFGGNLLWRQNISLDSLWNVFLTNKYTNQTNLANAWNVSTITPFERVVDGSFEGSALNTNWQLELNDAAALATMSQSTSNASAGTKSLQANITGATGTDWHVQCKYVNFSVKQDSNYIIRFKAKADANRALPVTLMMDGSPYSWFGAMTANLTTSWQEFSFVVKPTSTVTNGTRLAFNMGNATGTVYIDEVTVKEAVPAIFLAEENLAVKNIQRSDYSQRALYAPVRIKDETEFYITTQKNFIDNFRNYLRNDLGVVAPITGTNALTGVQQGMEHTNMDFVDDHSYHDHPYFPGTPWDQSNWRVNNTPMVKEENFWAMNGLFSGVGLNNKPFTVSEYNNVFPNRYKVEMVPAMAAYASFHGADAIMFFDYNTNIDATSESWSEDRVNGFFELHRDHSIMGLFPTCGYAFRNGYIAEATPTLINYTSDDIYNASQLDNIGRWGKYTPYDRRIQLTHSIRTGTYNGSTSYTTQTLPAIPVSPYTTSTNETTLNTTTGVLETVTPKYISVTGFLQDAPNRTLGSMQLVGANKFGAINWMSLDNKDLNISDTSFLAVSTAIQNTNMVWSMNNTTVGTNWGTAPTAIDALTATIRLQINAPQVILHKLSSIGAVVSSTIINPTAPNSNLFEITINQDVDKTMWYAIERINNITLPVYNIVLQANRASTHTTLEWHSNATDGFKTYKVQRSLDGVQFKDIKDIATQNNTRNSNLTNTDYEILTGKVYYRIEAITESGKTVYSNTVIVDKGNTKILVYPNPANDVINVITLNNEAGNFRLFDEKGGLVKKQNLQNTNNAINVNNLASGTYFFEIQTNSSTKKGTIVVKH